MDDLKRVTHFARQDEALFAEYINRKNTSYTRKEITALQKELEVMIISPTGIHRYAFEIHRFTQ
ncbi:MAG: hypothetical protein LBS02_07800 [Hungatella sp.]|nr:hypothetical protein [Hungatella sp.]